MLVKRHYNNKMIKYLINKFKELFIDEEKDQMNETDFDNMMKTTIEETDYDRCMRVRGKLK